jgi:hypothetical protein
MALHPDIVALRERYDRAGATPFAQAVQGLMFLAGGYAAISAWVVGFRGSSPALSVSNLITGIGLMVLAVGFATSYGRLHGLSWVSPLLGVWLIITPWVVQNTDRTTGLIVSNVVTGACVTVLCLGLTVLLTSARRRQLPD